MWLRSCDYFVGKFFGNGKHILSGKEFRKILFRSIEDKDYFVVTTNDDYQF